MSKKQLLVIFAIIFLLLLVFILFRITKKERPLDFDNNGQDDVSLIAGEKAFVFLKTDQGFIPALYFFSDSKWQVFSQNNEFIVLEKKGESQETKSSFTKAGKNLFGNEIWASGSIKDSNNNDFQVSLKMKKETFSSEEVFNGFFQVTNTGPNDAPAISFSFSFPLIMDAEKAYYFSPGIFYGDNNPVPSAAEEMRIPNLEKMKKDGLHTFLANRPMLPLVASWENNRMVMLAVEESSKAGKATIRNSLGWRIKENQPALTTWTHGYVFHRYVGPGDWEVVKENTSLKKGLLKNESIKKEFYLTFSEGELQDLFIAYRFFREHWRQNQTATVYENMTASLKTKQKSLPDFYDQEKGFFSQVANNKESVVNAWVGGTPAGYGLLRLGEYLADKKLADRARGFLDFLVQGSVSPSGFSYPIYSEDQWSTKGWWAGPFLQGIPARMASESTFYLLKAYTHELEQGREHQSWLDTALSNLEAAISIWESENDFGYSYQEEKPGLEKPGSSAGILWIGALSLGYEITGKEKYLAVAQEAAEVYAQNFLEKGLFYGCELDQGYSPDASCAAHAFTSYLVLYESTQNKTYLDYAKQAADIYATFVFSYNLDFAPESWAAKKNWTSLGMSTSGARNNHITCSGWPGFTDYLVQLYDATKDEYYLQLALDQYRASLEGYARNDFEFSQVPGMGKVATGYGFDWILHSDWAGEKERFGGIMHTGMLHQIYIMGANWPDTQEAFGSFDM